MFSRFQKNTNDEEKASEDPSIIKADIGSTKGASDAASMVDAETGNGDVLSSSGNGKRPNPIQSLKTTLQESSRKLADTSKDFHESKIRPALEKAGTSVRKVTEVTAQKSREISFGTQLAVAAATAHASHTVSQIGSNPLESDQGGSHKVKGESTDGFVTGFHQYGIQGLSVVAFVSGVCSMFLVVAHVVDFSSLIMMGIAPLVFWQKTKLQQLGGMRGQQNLLRDKVNALTMENGKLTASIDEMEVQVAALQHVEEDLGQIAAKAGGQVDRLVSIVHENGQIQKEIKAILQDEIMQQIITAVINTDKDQDYNLSKREVRQLEYRLKHIPGVVFFHDRFQDFIASDEGDLTLSDVIKIARNLGDDTVPINQQIFEFACKSMDDMQKQNAAATAVTSPIQQTVAST
mmetsp:Transcript_1641/g.2354  ORF Transcript_1641/g.2354 Transcript_1641/m.2354 type:complete len:405 (-) Transcript_1641:52-1266(-)|eukprot:CAMPEP_0198151170 /NCGR_PEP_ID=MMETSP1443-20131203/54560_1 /TAXON_ID=186043 /ORGANISM="Entomoneis sp., Strain CCMP2396" /LENGTH=404 /DNA_ID=CAMNT_0043816757 /DNA_START=137 /DNA_END=1351 /DNA_ORIENTATION=+